MRQGWLGAFVVLAACGSEAGPSDAALPDGGLDAGPSCTTLLWNGDAGGGLERWPDPSLVVEDPTTETGVRLRFDPLRFPALTARLGGYNGTFTEDLAETDGFGLNAEAFFQFGRAFDASRIPSGDDTVRADSGLGFVVLSPGPPRRVPVLTSTTDEGATLLLAPMTPLPPRALVAVYVTRALTAAAGGCLEPSAAMQQVLRTPDPATQDAIDALVALGAVRDAGDLVALTVFPTQSLVEDTLAVRADVEGRSFAFEEAPTCEASAAFIRCEARFRANDYRDPEDGVMRRARAAPATPRADYLIPVTVWLPPTGRGPFPTLLYGHGLTGGRDQAARLATFAAPAGFATVAIDALQHGEHPTAMHAPGALPTLLAFFAIGDLGTRALEAARLRDHFRQSTWDKLQLLSLLRSHPDLDGDGNPEIDVDALAYLGVSLGGLMGPELLATSTDLGAGVLVVPGGRVSTIISDGSQFGALIELLRPRRTTPGDVRRFFPVMQTVLDRGDPASFGPHVVGARLPGLDTRAPSVLVGVVLDDDTVPNVANQAVARALGAPMMRPVLRTWPGFPSLDGPLRGNAAGGRATLGVVQFDVVGDGLGGTRMATHDNVGDSDVGAACWFDFLSSHFAAPPAQIRDPYAAIGLGHASP